MVAPPGIGDTVEGLKYADTHREARVIMQSVPAPMRGELAYHCALEDVKPNIIRQALDGISIPLTSLLGERRAAFVSDYLRR